MAGTVASEFEARGAYDDDFAYVRDLGLIAPEPPTQPANPIYREVIVRALAAGIEPRVVVEPQRYIDSDGRLDMRRLLEAFADFWRAHGEILAGGLSYHEVAPQLVLMAFLQRVVNGGGRIDLLIRWPYRDTGGARQWQREPIELKIWRNKRADFDGRSSAVLVRSTSVAGSCNAPIVVLQ